MVYDGAGACAEAAACIQAVGDRVEEHVYLGGLEDAPSLSKIKKKG
jgi:hypothetical protein